MAETLLTEYGEAVASFTLVPSHGGVFEFEVDGDLVFSKAQSGRHTSPEEIMNLLAARNA